MPKLTFETEICSYNDFKNQSLRNVGISSTWNCCEEILFALKKFILKFELTEKFFKKI